MNEKVLVTDIYGDIAHYKPPGITSSKLTHHFPPRTAIAGFLGAILGLGRDEYPEVFSETESAIAVEIVNELKTIVIGQNYITPEKTITVQVPVHYLKRPKWRIYIHLKNEELHKRMKRILKRHEKHFHICLGISECIANYDYIGEFNLSKEKTAETDKPTKIHTIIPKTKETSIVIERGVRYAKDTVSAYMNSERKVLRYQEIYYAKNLIPITINGGNYHTVNEKNVIFY